MKRLLVIALAASMFVACGAQAGPTPQIIYVTPAPTVVIPTPSLETPTSTPSATPSPEPSQEPTPIPSPTPEPEPTQNAAGVACTASEVDAQATLDDVAGLEAHLFVDLEYATWAKAKAGAKHVAYKTFFRNNEGYLNEPVYFKGEVIQALYDEPFGGSDCTALNRYLDGTATVLRVNVTPDAYGYYSDTVYVIYLGSKRILENDIIDFVGMANGLQTYESTAGASITIPEAVVGQYLFVR
jgi:hypothetical protein